MVRTQVEGVDGDQQVEFSWSKEGDLKEIPKSGKLTKVLCPVRSEHDHA